MMIDAETKLVALLGDPVEHSLSPAMHNAAFCKMGLNMVYLAC
ncbi:MAG: shikimate dehydrogenase, partial [Thermovirga sp.]|nr:shikimate dehydrogenase [Thermovirga sp.]